MAKRKKKQKAPQAQSADMARYRERRYFRFHDAVRNHLERHLAWIRRGGPELTAYAAQYPRDVAFVLAIGPSARDVTDAQWDLIASRFSVGVNFVTPFLQIERRRFDLPSVMLAVDAITHPAPKARWNGAVEQSRGKALVDFLADEAGLAHDWCMPVCAMKPGWDLDKGAAISPRMVKFNRCSFAAAHLLAMLSAHDGSPMFGTVALLGVDHPKEYKPSDPYRAAIAFAHLRDLMHERGQQLVQCGKRAAFDSAPYIPIEEICRTHAKTAA